MPSAGQREMSACWLVHKQIRDREREKKKTPDIFVAPLLFAPLLSSLVLARFLNAPTVDEFERRQIEKKYICVRHRISFSPGVFFCCVTVYFSFKTGSVF